MADLTEQQSSQATKITGASLTGAETNYVDATGGGGLHANLRNNAGTEIGTVLTPVNVQLSDGIDTTKISTNQDLGVSDILDNSGVNAILSASSTPLAIRVGASNLVNRKRLTFMNNSPVTLYWGYSNAVSTANGFPLFRNQIVSDSWGPNTTIWIVAATGSGYPVPTNEGA